MYFAIILNLLRARTGVYSFYVDARDGRPVAFHVQGHNVVLGGSHTDDYWLGTFSGLSCTRLQFASLSPSGKFVSILTSCRYESHESLANSLHVARMFNIRFLSEAFMHLFVSLSTNIPPFSALATQTICKLTA